MRFRYNIYATFVLFALLLGSSAVQLAYLDFYSPSNSSLTYPASSSINVQNSTGIMQDNNIFWFLHITDTQNIWDSPEREDWFGRFFNETAQLIKPMMIFNTGDLVDSDYSGFLKRHEGQLEYEWVTYARILNETGQNVTNYFDMLGNHDVYSDPGFSYYRNYSIQKKPYYDFVVDLGFGKYHFIALNMAEDFGMKYPFSLFGHLNKTELDWYENVLSANTNADLTFTFGHMPAYEVYEGRFRYFQLNRKYDVDLYLTGHGHENTYQMVDNRMPSWETGHLTETYRIITVDNNIISTSVQFKDKWPVGIITSPVDVRNINPEFNRTLLENPNEIHVMAWDPSGIAKVEWRWQQDDDDETSWTDWVPMQLKNGSLYSAPWTVIINDDKTHLVQSRITPNNGTMKIEEIEYRNEEKTFFNWTYRGTLIVIGFFGLVMGIPIGKYVLRKINKISPKHSDQKVNKDLLKLLLLKLLIIICIPLTFTELIPDSFVALFGWGLIGKSGIIFNDIASMVGAFLVIFGIFLPSLNLSFKKRYWIVFVVLPLSILLQCMMIIVTVILIDFYAVIAPGLYLLIGVDFFIYKKIFQIQRTLRKL